jgi:hypothetical protein
VHARKIEEHEEVTLDDAREPIGLNNKVVSELSNFLETFALSATYCPLIYTSFKGFIYEEKDAMWNFVNIYIYRKIKFIISDWTKLKYTKGQIK